MPPKFNKKKNAPLTSLERRAQKKKQELIHKARVKSEYYKTLEKEHADSTPDYVKEIFEKTIDQDGNIVEYAANKRKRNDLDKEPNPDNEDNLHKLKKGKNDKDITKSNKPNPFKAQLEEQEKRKKLTKEQREEREKELEKKKKATKKYYHDRNKMRGKMLAKHKNGQPNLATQLDVLIGRLNQQN
ncbi:hypothetical protein BJ944DRAFT_13263 [Cunninghamella echinulata]|nr:hypothetical protein BJ944DRAFT_13263 [Cunninghamella echinulata]